MVEARLQKVMDKTNELEGMIPKNLNGSDIIPADIQEQMKRKTQEMLDEFIKGE